jgi:hypothetical protein
MTFYGTSSNGKYPVMTTELLKGRGINKVSNEPNGLVEHKCKIYKNMYRYWITEKAFNALKEKTNMTRAYGI